MTPPLFIPALGRSFYPGATTALGFTRSLYKSGTPVVKGSPSGLSNWAFSRASAGNAENVAGLVIPFASGVPRITDKGLLVELSRTNVVLWNRDLTNAAWTNTSITAAKDQTGADGVANSATSLTATGANGTCLQAITLGSSARFQTAYVKRIAGSGVVNMTMDNGATWTAVTVTSAWTRVSIPTQTLANPTVGFRIVTSGDAIAVDYVQNENGAFQSSPIATTTASATRAEDIPTLSGQSLTTGYSVYAEWSDSQVTGARVIDGGPGTFAIRRSGATVTFNCNGIERNRTGGTGLTKAIVAAGASDMTAALNGVAAGVSSGAFGAITITSLVIGNITGGGSSTFAYMRTVLIYPRSFTAAEQLAITT